MNIQSGNLRNGSRYDELVQDYRIHGSIYTDKEVFEEELDRIFHRGWVYVGHDTEIPENGDFRARHIGRQPVLMVRGDDGVVRVLMNRCTHKASVVCVHDRGSAKLFTCPYHGWSFRNTGKLAATPYGDRYDESFNKDDYALRPAPRMAIYRGFVFASLAETGVDFDDHLNPRAKAQLDLTVDLAPDGVLDVTAGTHKYGYGGNWKLQAENNIDGYHVNSTHASFWDIMYRRTGTRMNIIGTDTSPVTVRSLGNGHVAWDYSPFQKKVAERAFRDDPKRPEWQQHYYDSLVARLGKDRTVEVLSANPTHFFIFPNLSLIAQQIRTIRPIAVDKTELFIYPTLLAGAPREINTQRIKAHEAFYGPAGGGATDDLDVFERVQHGLQAQVDPWIPLNRGIGKEWADADGAVVSQVTDDLGSRSILHHWRSVMSAGA